MWNAYLERYRSGLWRAPIFRDLVLADVQRFEERCRVLDIGCGRGFDDDLTLQKSIASASSAYIGVEPDREIPLGCCFTESHCCLFEDAPIPPDSVDVAFAVMVLEHIPSPQTFWSKLFEVLRPGGVFWGFTMDARHWFCTISNWAGRLRVKDFYLDRVHGRKREGRYENYPVFYRSNTPGEITSYATQFQSCEFINFSKIGELDYYLPGPLKRVGHALDRRTLRRGKPGSVLAVRAVK